MAGRTYRSIWSGVATAGSQDGGVDTAQASALVTRPTCSWTSTCWRVVHPPPPSSLGMFVAQIPSSRARVACAAARPAGSSPPASSACSSYGITPSAKVRARFWMSRSSSVSPYIALPCSVLTDCSVYVSIGLVPMTSPGHPGSADAVVVGGGTIGGWCAYFLRRAGLDRVVLLGQWSRRFYLGQRDELGIDSGFVAQGYLLPCFTEAEVAAAGERLAMQAALGVPVRWLGPAE